MDKEERKRRLERFLKGEEDPEGRKLFDAWFKQVDQEGLRSIDSEGIEAAADSLEKRLQERIRTRKSRTVRFRRVAVAAASIALLIGMFWQLQQGGWLSSISQNKKNIEYVTGPGQSETITLPDGTTAYLNQNSALVLDKDFGKNGFRNVQMDGEAFFEVAHDKEHPFQVQANGGVVKVLGTRFNVSAAKDAGEIMVAVQEGLVALRESRSSEEQQLLLHAGEGGLLANGSLEHLAGAEIDNYLAWRTGTVTFNSLPLAEVAAQLQRMYRVDIRFDANIDPSKRLTLSYKYAALDEMLDVICHALELDYNQLNDHEFIIIN